MCVIRLYHVHYIFVSDSYIEKHTRSATDIFIAILLSYSSYSLRPYDSVL